ncbi:MAG: hypothetical protein BAJALOKI1v1_250018 [Promethearchaeota archaeon]|nr:MAG: hypothetical protein BAJALOKI1v1_250018 [Candidatus Lokiarchaeota archaeon]
MIIRKIEIENVKTHKNTSITFKEGLNVLYGGNGAGKSTVLEMIGFVLFDFLKSKTQHSDYVRSVENDNPTYGTVKVWITGLENKTYQILRTIGKTEIEVRDTKGELLSPPIDTVSKFRTWIQTQLGVRFDIDLETLFNTAIGIPQGMIINSFLLRPQERKDYFDKIFQLEIYEKYRDNLLVIERNYKEDINKIENQISELKGETKNKEDLIITKQNLSDNITILTEQLENYNQTNEKINKKLQEYTLIKEELEKITTSYAQNEIEKKSEEEHLKNLQQQLNESVKAQNICDRTKNAYEEYNKLSKLKNELILKNQTLDELKEKLNELIQTFQVNKNRYDNLQEKLDEAETSHKKLEQITSSYQEYLKLEEELKTVLQKIAKISSDEEHLQKADNDLTKLKDQLTRLNKEIEKLPKLEKALEIISSLEEKKNTLKVEHSSIEDAISFFESNQKKIEDQLCPFTDQKCKNIEEGKFDIDFFTRQIEEKKKDLTEIKVKLNEISNKIGKKEKIQEAIEHLTRKKFSIEGIETQIEQLKEEISNLRTKVAEKETLTNLRDEMLAKTENLKSYHDEYVIHEAKAKNINQLKEHLHPLLGKLKTIKQERFTVQEQIKSHEDIPKQLSDIRKKSSELEPDYNQYQIHINEAQKLKDRKEKVNAAKQKLEMLEKESNNKLNEKMALESKFDEDIFTTLQNEFNENKGMIIKLHENVRNLQQRIKEIEETLNKLEQKERELHELKEHSLKLRAQKKFVNKIRNWLRAFKPKMRIELIKKVNMQATQIYRSIRGDQNTSLIWDKDYEIEVVKAKSRKRFIRLSGGEKMAAALAIRLAILKTLTSAQFAIFDEPTTNLDEVSRINLSKYINNIEGFTQLFVISHDDSFKRHSDYVIKLTKDSNEETIVNYLTAN